MPERGDVVVVTRPSDDVDLIKRVIGLPGDHITNDGQGGPLKVNGVAVNEPYLKPGDSPSLQAFDITVPAGRVWVMGDHRSDSSDSRFHPLGGDGSQGSVPERLIVGRAVTDDLPASAANPTPPAPDPAAAVVVLCDSLFVADCGGPAEQAAVATWPTALRAVDRWQPAPGRTLSVYVPASAVADRP